MNLETYITKFMEFQLPPYVLQGLETPLDIPTSSDIMMYMERNDI